jgi:antitoxin component YwqK of YwqJK toxin-antitoxin module
MLENLTKLIDEKGNKYWYLNGLLHREDGPAVELANGTKQWYLNGQLHRTDGPAIEFKNGEKRWYLNGKLCRKGKFTINVKLTEN